MDLVGFDPDRLFREHPHRSIEDNTCPKSLEPSFKCTAYLDGVANLKNFFFIRKFTFRAPNQYPLYT